MDDLAGMTREQLIQVVMAFVERERALSERVKALEAEIVALKAPKDGGPGPTAPPTKSVPTWVRANKPPRLTECVNSLRQPSV
jgi:hypothetical protein